MGVTFVRKTMNCKLLFCGVGGGIGWLIAELKPAFPLAIIAIVFIVYDAWTAYQLDKRVKAKYPDKARKGKAKFTSSAFSKVVKSTIPKRLWLILLAYLVEHWVFIHFTIPLSYIVTGAICFEQAWSIMENESSCRDENESRFWKLLQMVMVDKTERHFDVNLDGLKQEKKEEVTTEQVVEAYKIAYGKKKKGGTNGNTSKKKISR